MIALEPIPGPDVPLFDLGEIIITHGANVQIARRIVMASLRRHHCGDWGELDNEDRLANERALTQSGRLFSVYRNQDKERFYIITEADRSMTTIMMPNEY
jgi:hypothetical protein